MFKLRIYKKNLEYSYAFGVFPVMELLKQAPQFVDQIIFSSNRFGDPDIKAIIELCKVNKLSIAPNDHKIKMLAPKENTFIIGVFKKFNYQLHRDKPHVVLVSPTNTGNMGMIIRTMLAFGINDLAIIKPAVDVFDPKVIASSVGALFQIRAYYYDSLSQYISENHSTNTARKIFTFTLNKGQDLREIDFAKFDTENTFSLVFGNEANGLSEDDANSGERLTIPQVGQVDSLNLSVATAVALWEVARTKSKPV